jgi:hypothetical protein
MKNIKEKKIAQRFQSPSPQESDLIILMRLLQAVENELIYLLGSEEDRADIDESQETDEKNIRFWMDADK